MRVKGLDTLRFVLALVVVMGHTGFDFTQYADSRMLKAVLGIANNAFNGQAAVIMFFIISGFCIHFPYAMGKSMNASEFMVKRIIRISIPAIAGVALFYFLTDSLLGVVWSLVCELIYYIFYPFILKLIYKKENIFKRHIIILSVLMFLSLATSLYYGLTNVEYHGGFLRSGYSLTWLVGFPVWYLGVILADVYVKGINFSALSLKYILVYRAGILALSMLCSIARFHLNVSYVYSLVAFSIPGFFWLYAELMYYKEKKENTLLEFGGMMSYSIYIVHESAFKIFLLAVMSMFSLDTLKMNIVNTMGLVTATLLISAVFYKLIEKPSHKLAQRIKFQS